MIIRRLERGSSLGGAAAERRYMTSVSSYIVRAKSEDLKWLAETTRDPFLQDLANYIMRDGALEQVAACGAVGLHGDSIDEWQAELQAMLHNCPNSDGVVSHWVMSWPEGEKPHAEQIQDCIETFQTVMGGGKQFPIVWGRHDDTDNPHLHPMVVGIDSETGKRIELGGGWQKDTAMRVKAVLEARHGWEPEPNSRYNVVADKLIHVESNQAVGVASTPLEWRPPPKRDAASKPKAPEVKKEALAWEEETGLMSRERIAAEIAAPLLLTSKSFPAAHKALAQEGIRLLRKGTNGAVLEIDGKQVCNTRENRLSALEARYGSIFVPAPKELQVTDRGPRSMWAGDEAMKAYYAAKRAHDAELRQTLASVRAAMTMRGTPSALISEVSSALAAEISFPTLSDFSNGQAAPAISDIAWSRVGVSCLTPAQYRTHAIPIGSKLLPPNIGAFRAFPGRRGATIYRRGGAAAKPAFVAIGNVVVVNVIDPETVRAAMRLLAGPDGKGSVKILAGGKDFRDMVAQIAEQDGIRIEKEPPTRLAKIVQAVFVKPIVDVAETVGSVPSAKHPIIPGPVVGQPTDTRQVSTDQALPIAPTIEKRSEKFQELASEPAVDASAPKEPEAHSERTPDEQPVAPKPRQRVRIDQDFGR
jgi:Relaxase/Mobilisation nuclease domain